MPNPSKACQTCKTRRVKCDETKPICNRCVKARRECFPLEAVKQASFLIHVENRYASGQTKRPRGPRSALYLTPVNNATTAPSVDPSSLQQGQEPVLWLQQDDPYPLPSLRDQACPPPLQQGEDLRQPPPQDADFHPLPQQVEEDLETKAMTYFLNHHLELTSQNPKTMSCVTSCLHAWNQSGRTCTMVNLALSSLALAVYWRTHLLPAAAVQASTLYDRLLPIARQLLTKVHDVHEPTLDQTYIEGCLLTVMLMGQYDSTVYCPRLAGLPPRAAFVSSTSWWHHDGAMAILKVWYEVLSQTSKPSCIIRHARRGYIRSALLRAIPLPEWMSDGGLFGEEGLDLDYDSIMVRVVDLRHKLSEIQTRARKGDGPGPMAIEMLNNHARDLDTALRVWAIKIPVSHSLTRHILADWDGKGWPRQHFFSSMVYAYAQPAYAALWAQYYSARMLVNSMRLRILGLLIVPSCPLVSADYEEQRSDTAMALQAMADSLACALPSVVGHIRTVEPTSISQYDLGSSRTGSLLCSVSGLLPGSDSTSNSGGSSVAPTDINDGPEVKPHLAGAAGWPLMIACSVEGIDRKQHEWFRAELAYIGKVTGNGVLQCADTDQWIGM
ncbi:hypothetical protein PV11_05625 [Exophiala sideris]|uniref:Zn(2)-C6 fungal-type domain-containing protein n=1 Tax=Exophiala sideris TaxID=1016849 RepID=A0A0D1YLB2_9EURO|nr:hypothetical protein PV11_05625 [Exophiala sideris]